MDFLHDFAGIVTSFGDNSSRWSRHEDDAEAITAWGIIDDPHRGLASPFKAGTIPDFVRHAEGSINDQDFVGSLASGRGSDERVRKEPAPQSAGTVGPAIDAGHGQHQ